MRSIEGDTNVHGSIHLFLECFEALAEIVNLFIELAGGEQLPWSRNQH